MIQIPTDVGLKVLSTLRGAPMLIALLLINAATLGMITYLTIQAAEMRGKERSILLNALERCYLREQHKE